MVLTWTELCCNSTNKPDPRKQYRTCNMSFVVTFHIGRKQEIVLTAVKKSCFAFVVTAASLLWWRNDVLHLFTRKGIFLLISFICMMSFLLCCYVFFCFPSQPTWTLVVPNIKPVQDMMLLCLFTVFSCLHVHIIKVFAYENYNFSFSLKHPHVRLYECFVFPLPFFCAFCHR